MALQNRQTRISSKRSSRSAANDSNQERLIDFRRLHSQQMPYFESRGHFHRKARFQQEDVIKNSNTGSLLSAPKFFELQITSHGLIDK